MATAIGPIAGGALTQHPSWRWTFWFLVLFSGLCLISVALVLPETSRFIVGNGSREVTGFHRSIVSYIQLRKLAHSEQRVQDLEKRTESRPDEVARIPFRLPNPLASLKILWAKDAISLTMIYGIYYMNFSCLQASLSTLVIRLYKYSELEAGLLYLPFGFGSILGAYSSGLIMDRDYRTTARKHNITINKKSGDDLRDFPIEKARFCSIWYFISLSGIWHNRLWMVPTIKDRERDVIYSH